MKNFKLNTAILSAALFAGSAAFLAPAHAETAGQYVDDAVITTGVKAAIVKEPSLKATEINVETQKGVVQLSGFVASADNIPTAVKVAGAVKGVKSVKNDIHVKGAAK
jgi:osmotically-inducible protein OsmY